MRQQTEVSNRLVTVVDVPGWEGGPEGLTPERVKREIGLSVTLVHLDLMHFYWH